VDEAAKFLVKYILKTNEDNPTSSALPADDLIVQLYYIILSAVYNFEIIKYLLCILFSMINTCLNNFSGLERVPW